MLTFQQLKQMVTQAETEADKALWAKLALETILYSRNLKQKYRVELTGTKITIRPSLGNPATEEEKSRYDQLIALLLDKGMINGKSVMQRVNVQATGGRLFAQRRILLVPATEVAVPDAWKLFNFINPQAQPSTVDQDIWASMSDVVKERWDLFSEDMQKHIIECIKLDKTRLEYAIELALCSPLTCEPFKIPVRMPNSDQVLDLCDLIQSPLRDTDKLSNKLDPYTRKPFTVSELIPDLQKLQMMRDTVSEMQYKRSHVAMK